MLLFYDQRYELLPNQLKAHANDKSDEQQQFSDKSY